MTRVTLTLCAVAATGATLLSPAACSPNAHARPAVKPAQQVEKERESKKDADSVRTVRRHSSDIDRTKQEAKADRPRDDQMGDDDGQAMELVEDATGSPEGDVAYPDLPRVRSQPPEFWVWTKARGQDLSVDQRHWGLENVYPLVCAMTNVPYSHGFSAPGYPVPVRQFGADGEPIEIDPDASAQQMFGFVAWHRQALLARGRTQFKYSIWPQNWGTRHHDEPEDELENILALGVNPRDRLANTNLPYNAAYESFYGATGIELNKQWSEAFIEGLDGRLNQAGIPDPHALFFDLEAAFPIRKAMYWWTAALDDPRADTELVDGLYTMSQIDQMAPSYDASREIWRPENRAMYAYVRSVAQRVLEHAIWEGFWAQAADVWPNAILSNYDLHGGTSAEGVPDARLGVSVKSAPLRHADYASPILYGFPDWAINGADTLTDHMERFGVADTGDPALNRRKLTVAFHKARIDALAESGIAMAPWISPPDFADLTIMDTVEVMKHGTDRGVRHWLLWSQHDYDWTPILQAVTAYAEQHHAGNQPGTD